MGYGTNGLSFRTLRDANTKRLGSSKYRKCESDWTPAHWMQATVGELGELANLMKKVDRGDFSLDEARADIAKELADVQTYLDIMAFKLGVDLGEATKDKFNEVSERIGSPVYIGDDDDWHLVTPNC
jgi:NTP pyrophosphatase (non-canonical NTP hydrolase)